MADRWGNNENGERLYILGLQNHCRWWLQPWNEKMLAPWKKSYDKPRQHIKKQRHYFANKGLSSQGYGFSCGHVERLHFHFSLSCIGGGNGNPLQCSCLENPRDGRAWWAAVYGVAQSRTRLKRLSSSSSNEAKRRLQCFQEMGTLHKENKPGSGI